MKKKKKYNRAERGGGEANVIRFEQPTPQNVVRLPDPKPVGVNFYRVPKCTQVTFPAVYAAEAALLAKIIPCSKASEKCAPQIISGQDTAEIWMNEVIGAPWYDPHKEALVAMALDARRRCQHVFLISLGSLTETLASPREVFRPLILAAAYTFILCHNHPTGNPEPSDDDKELAKRMQEAGRLMEIPMLDFVIFGHPEETGAKKVGINYYSFNENKQL